jgi:hypothetical protein
MDNEKPATAGFSVLKGLLLTKFRDVIALISKLFNQLDKRMNSVNGGGYDAFV